MIRGVLLLLFLMSCGTVYADDHKQPNIIYILTDDLGWGDLSCYGQEHWETPRLDALASEGMLFTNAYAGNTVCAPSRAALLTGNHSGRVWQRGNGSVQFRRDPLDITIATRLQDAGYRTAMIGKSAVACNSGDIALPNDKGFDHFYGLLSHSAAHRNYPSQIARDGEWIDLPGNEGYTGTTYVNELFVARAVEWIEETKDEPFFLHLAITPPHADMTVPERYMAPFRGRFKEVPNSSGGYYHQAEPRAAYAGMVAFIDEAVGRVVDSLHEHGIAEDTVIFFSSDNGPHFEGGADPEAFKSAGPFRGGKRAMFDGGIRVPQIVWWPGTISPEQRTDFLTAFWDFPPTALELAGVTPPDSMDGISIAPLLRGDTGEQAEHDYLYWEFYEQGGKQAIRTGQWKGIRRDVNSDRNAPIELYDLDADPGETRNVAASNPEIVASIAEMMDEAHEPSPIFAFEERPRSRSKPRGQRRISNTLDEYLLDRSGFTVVETSSHSVFNGRTGELALDDDLTTWWHTEWRDGQPNHPHSIVIDLGAAYEVMGVRVMARQDGADHGTVSDGTLRVASSPAALDQRDGQRFQLRFTKNEQQVLFKNPVTGRYLKLETTDGHANTPYACFANIEVLGRPAR